MDHALDQANLSQCHLSGTAGAGRGLLVGLVFFVGIAPTLSWLEFSNGIENLNVETALEMRRGGPWLIPTLMGEPRVRKPPLNAWITALAVRPDTVRDMSSLDTPTREAAWKDLSWQTRWPALLASGLTLAFAYELGRTLLGHQIGLYGAIIAGTTLLYLKYARAATTDVHLALWVTVTHVCLAKLVFERRVWAGLIGSGIALGMGMMSKGPVTFVMTLVPLLSFLILRTALSFLHAGAERTRAARDPFPEHGGSGSSRIRSEPGVIVAALLGLTLMLVIGFGWFVYTARQFSNQSSVWWMEVLRTDPAEEATAHWYDYIKLLAQMMPWTPLFIVGLCLVAMTTWRLIVGHVASEQREVALRVVYAAALFIVPILIMSFFRDRKVRYLYPFAVPCGILTAKAIVDLLETSSSRLFARCLVAVHWLVLAGLTIGLAVRGMLGWKDQVRLDGSPWFTPAFGISAAVACGVLVMTCALVQLRHRSVLVFGSLLVMLLFQAINTQGNRVGRSGEGASEMLPLARVLWDRHPDVILYDVEGRKNIPPDLAIYMNRIVKKTNQISLEPQAQLQVVMQKRGAPEPQPEPGWRLLMKTPRDKDWWVAFVRDPKDQLP
jgi:hypothetical protein